MKKLKQICTVFTFLLISFQGISQSNDIGKIAKEFKFLAGNFAQPAATGASYQSNGGWFSSAKTLDKWTFEFSVHANVLFVPSKKREFAVSNADFDNLHSGENILYIKGAETALIPTAFGGSSEVLFGGEVFGQTFQFQALEGIDKNIIAHPFVQASVGLPLGTEFIFRFLPEITVDGADFSTYGIGLKHNFNQYFFNPQPNDFQFAALVAYSNFKVNYELLRPVDIPDVAFMEGIAVKGDLWLLQVISSKTFYNSGFELFAAAGATNSSFNYTIGGTGASLPYINTELESLNENEMEFKGDVGFNYTAGRFKLSSMLSMGKFLNYNLGLHFRL